MSDFVLERARSDDRVRRSLPGRHNHEVAMKPFIPWPGGKRFLAPKLIANFPSVYGDYYEPFLGGAAVFLRLRPKKAYLSDVNTNLINAYNVVKTRGNAFIEQFRILQERHEKEDKALFDELALEERAGTGDAFTRAWRYVYCVNASFAARYRTNKGGFNSWFDPTKQTILNKEYIKQASISLQNADVTLRSFDTITPKRGDFVYLDPPYDNADPRLYQKHKGSIKDNTLDQPRIADFCAELDRAGVLWMQSNADTPLIRSLYANFHVSEIKNLYCMSRGGEMRTELVITNYETPKERQLF